ncbi:DUF1853 family protein [Aurantibacter sp.]|uniref:DUF1853 family protein n=1 Tax=Aurantibacter sp. TaxID=2807103 RepID=UPI0035C83F03
MNNLQLHFSGFYNTPHLFKNEVYGMKPYLTLNTRTPVFNTLITKNYRLGQLVERFVSNELKQNTNIKVLSENYQVNKDKITLGELDAIIRENNQPIHLEIQFKFYLYDATLGKTDIECFIGPNRKDSLVEKLNKLKYKQLPLLYKEETKPLLDSLNLKLKNISQNIYFKAQLFLPYNEDKTFNNINKECVYGFYFNYNNLDKFKGCKFYIPKKIDWLLDVNANVSWSSLNIIKLELDAFYTEKYSPLVWLKFPNGEISKCFVVYW